MVLAVLPFVFGCAIVFDSVMTLQNAIDLRRLGFSRWWLILLLAGVTGAFGVLLFFEPFAALAMVRFIGAVLVLDGCADLVSVLCLTYWVKKAKRGLEAIYDEARYEAAAIEAEGRIQEDVYKRQCVSCKYNEKAVPVGTAFSRLLRNGMPYLCAGSRQLTCACACLLYTSRCV